MVWSFFFYCSIFVIESSRSWNFLFFRGCFLKEFAFTRRLKFCISSALVYISFFLFIRVVSSSTNFWSLKIYSVHPPSPLFCWGGEGGVGVLNLHPNFHKGELGLTGPQLWEGVAGVGNLFQGVAIFTIKNKLKSKLFDDKKKSINKNVFLCYK